MVEHLLCKQGVVGSSPIVSTIPDCTVRLRSRPKKTKRFGAAALDRARRRKLFDKLGWWNEIVEDLE